MARYTEFAMAACRMALLAMATLTGVAQEARAEPRAVVELFTSQGCSSCPPADALLGKLAHDPNVIALTLAIDYWDYIGWKDTLALPGHTNRQKAYSKVRGERGVYTPQVIVNGTTQALGSDQADIERPEPSRFADPVDSGFDQDCRRTAHG